MMRKLWLGLLLLLAVLALGPASAQQPLTFQITGPAGSNPLMQSTTGTTGTVTVTLTPANSAQFTYICGFVVTSGASGSATVVNGTITGLGGSGTFNFEYVFVSSGQGVLGVALGPGCLTSSAKNTPIVVTVPGGGSGTAIALTAWGYSL